MKNIREILQQRFDDLRAMEDCMAFDLDKIENDVMTRRSKLEAQREAIAAMKQECAAVGITLEDRPSSAWVVGGSQAFSGGVDLGVCVSWAGSTEAKP